MDALKGAVTAFSIFLLIGGCLMMLVPDGSIRKVYSFLVSLIILLLILTFFQIRPDLDLDVFQNSEVPVSGHFAESVQKAYLDAAKDATRTLVTEQLDKENIYPAEIRVDADILEDGRISIEYVEVVLQDAQRLDDCYQLLKKEIGGNISVTLQEVKN